MCLKISNSLKEKKTSKKRQLLYKRQMSCAKCVFCSEVLLYFEALKCRHLVLVHVDTVHFT